MSTNPQQQQEAGTGPAAGLPVHITPQAAVQELAEVRRKLAHGLKRIGEFTEDDLAIATAPNDEVWREDMVRLYKCRPTTEKRAGISVLIVYALVGRYQMIDLETDRSFVRKLLAEGIDVYFIDWGTPGRAQRWLTIDDYVSGYLDACVDVVREREGIDKANLIGICQGGVFSTCYSALHPHKVARLVLTVTPLDFHGDLGSPGRGSGYMNLWARSLSAEDIDRLIDTMGNSPGPLVGFSFLMMNPVANVTKYSIDLLDILDDDRKLLGFLRMERWISDRPNNPGEVVRQWFKDLYQGNKLVKNELVLGGRTVDLRDITMPVLNVYADGDVVVPNACSQGMEGRFGTDDYSELAVPGGHIGTFVGGKAQKILAPSIVRWLRGEKLGADAAAGAKPATEAGRPAAGATQGQAGVAQDQAGDAVQDRQERAAAAEALAAAQAEGPRSVAFEAAAGMAAGEAADRERAAGEAADRERSAAAAAEQPRAGAEAGTDGSAADTTDAGASADRPAPQASAGGAAAKAARSSAAPRSADGRPRGRKG